MITLKQFNKEYFKGKTCVEETNKEQALSFFKSRTSAGWGNSHIKGTGWSVILRPSKLHKDSVHTVLVCKTELIGQNTTPYLNRTK